MSRTKVLLLFQLIIFLTACQPAKDLYEPNENRGTMLREIKLYGPDKPLDLVCDWGDLKEGETVMERTIPNLSFHTSEDIDNFLLLLSNRKAVDSTVFYQWNVLIDPGDQTNFSMYDDGGGGVTKNFNSKEQTYENLAPGIYNIQLGAKENITYYYDLTIRCERVPSGYEISFEPPLLYCDDLGWIPEIPDPGPYQSPFGYFLSTLEGEIRFDLGRLFINEQGLGFSFDEPISHLHLDFSGNLEQEIMSRFFYSDDRPFTEQELTLSGSNFVDLEFADPVTSVFIWPTDDEIELINTCSPIPPSLE